jgi:cell wall-associated NlpC family hydrolase
LSRCRSLAVAVLAAGLAAPVVPADADAARRTFGARDLRAGMRGTDVRVLQDFLTRVGLRTTVDGHFGPYTARRVRSWERKSQRRVNGRVERTDAQVLRAQVAAGTTVVQPRAAQPVAPVTGGIAPGAAPVATEKAVVNPDGTATAPASAPPQVHAIIAAGNLIAKLPYRYGGGHGRWEDSGYDCSGSMSFAFHGAGMLEKALDSTAFMSWGDPGPGAWVTTYANPGHSFMVVAGLRFDTSGRSTQGTRWQKSMRSTAGYTVRHPPGL